LFLREFSLQDFRGGSTLKWACLKLAKLGRWYDSKRTGRPGWVVMWDGWFRLQDMVEGYLVMKSLDQEI
ncbi:IS4 family transposase, partial [Escherichia coli]|nr:IS4 family transposase [Escherichia coli]